MASVWPVDSVVTRFGLVCLELAGVRCMLPQAFDATWFHNEGQVPIVPNDIVGEPASSMSIQKKADSYKSCP